MESVVTGVLTLVGALLRQQKPDAGRAGLRARALPGATTPLLRMPQLAAQFEWFCHVELSGFGTGSCCASENLAVRVSTQYRLKGSTVGCAARRLGE